MDRVWAGQIRADDRYGMLLLSRAYQNEAGVLFPLWLQCGKYPTAEQRQFWFDDLGSFYPECRN